MQSNVQPKRKKKNEYCNKKKAVRYCMIMIMIVSKVLSNSASGSGKAIHTNIYIYEWKIEIIFFLLLIKM